MDLLLTTKGSNQRIRYDCWNVLTLYQSDKFAQLSAECKRLNFDLLSISEMRWNGQKEVKTSTGDLVLYSGLTTMIHTLEVGIYLSKRLAPSLITGNRYWNGLYS